MTALDRPTRRAVLAFVESVGGQADRPSLLDVEELIAVANLTYEAILTLDGRWHESVADGDSPYDPEMIAQLEGIYRDWAVAASLLAERALGLASTAAPIRGLDGLIAAIDVASATDTGDAPVMSADLIAMRDEALAEHRAGRSVDLLDGLDEAR